MDPGIPHKELRRFLDHPRPFVPDPALPRIWNKVTKMGLAFIHILFAILKFQWCKNATPNKKKAGKVDQGLQHN